MPVLAWKCLYPVGIHFVLSQLVSYLGLYFLVQRTGADMSAYYQHVLMLTGLTGILAAVPAYCCIGAIFQEEKKPGYYILQLIVTFLFLKFWGFL